MFTKSTHYLGQLIAGTVAAIIMPILVLYGAGKRESAAPSVPLVDSAPPTALMVDQRPEANAGLDLEVRQAGADESWWQTVSTDLERQEYAASPTSDGLQAPNRSHNLRTIFRERGIEVVPRMGKDVAPAWRFVWETSGFGRPGRMQEVSPSAPTAAGARVTYQRDGWSEWYENTTKGLEQGFTVDRRPEGEGPLQIAGTFPQVLRPEMREDGAVDFLDEHGACAIRYGELHVWDANGREVDSRLAVEGHALAILVEDDGAAYPITVDPLMTSPAWTAESNQTSALFGISVATAGDVNGDGFSDVIVGAYQYDNGESDEGRTFVYHGSAAGLATTHAWTAEWNQVGAGFGYPVATAGDVNGDGFSDVIVGAYQYDNGESDEGRAFVYHGSGAGLAITPAWTAESNQAGASLDRVATAGDVNGDGFSDVIVGVGNYDNGEIDEGRAFVYHGSAAGLATTAAWTVDSNIPNFYFGLSVATAGDVNGDGFSDVIVGAFQGAFAYYGSAAGLATTAAWGEQEGGNFGVSLSTAGDVNGDGYSDVIIGAQGFDNGQTDEGRAFVYHGSAGGLGATPAWTAESNQAGAAFGFSVSTAGDVNGDGFSDVIVGAYRYDNGQTDEGRAFAYQGSAAGLATTPAWTAESNQESAFFGFSLATAGDVNGDGFSDVIVGAYVYDNGETDEGRAFVYHGSGAGLATAAGWTADGNQDGAFFGWSGATAGDVNGDGFSDVIVGAPSFNNGEIDEGRAFVYHGSAAGLALTPAWTAEPNLTNARFGFSVATAGDVNGDGFSDVIVGADYYNNGQTDEGRAFVYHGSAAGLAPAPAWTAESNQGFAQFGISVATAGDVNGDGFSDIIVGADEYTNGEPFEGRAFVYHGSSTGLATTPAWTAESNRMGADFGYSVATAGDVNGDGFSDVIVGAYGYSNGEIDEGGAFVYLGSAAGLAPAPAWTVESNQAGAEYGFSVATAGDVNGDGFSDVIVGAVAFNNGQTDEGGAFVYHGSAAGLASTPAWTAESNQFEGYFGVSLATAGDVNGDGFSDIIVGALGYDNVEFNEGRAFAYHGSAAGLSLTPAWTAETNHADSGLGRQAAMAGDVNGDGFSDTIVGAHLYNDNQINEGRAFLYYGNDGDGLDRIARQARTDDAAPIDLLGRSNSPSSFRLKALGRTPAGRGRVRLQYEVKPAHTLFDGTGLVTGAVTNTGSPGANGSAVALSQLATGLTAESLYHWRLRIVTDSPFFPRSRWLSPPYNAPSEADVRTGEATAAVLEQNLPQAGLWLAPAAPNPFNPRTTIVYVLPARMRARLAIHDVQGRLVRVLVDEVQQAGQHEIEWDGRDARDRHASTGIYFSRLEAGDEVRFQKLALVK